MTYGIGSRTYDQFYRTGELLRAQFFSLDVFGYNSNPNWLCKFQLLQSKFKPINSSQFLSVINKSLANSMGTNHPTVFQTGEPLTNYDVVQKVPEHNLSYLKHKITNKQFLIKQFAINDKTEFTQLCQKLKNRKKLQSQYLTKLQRFSEQLEDHLCSSFYKVFAMWEYPSHTLADQINERTLQKRHFQQNQLFSIIASVIQGMSCLQSSGIKHQSLTTSTILFDQKGIVKITDPLTQIHPSNFQRINSNRKLRNVYIASEQSQALKNQRPIPNRNPFKSDVFVLGVIMLECGLLQRMEELYVDGFEDVDFQELAQKMEQFGKVYSRDLRLTVETMLARDPKQRMDWIGLKQYVPEKGESDKQRQIHSNKQVYNNFSNPNNKLINQNQNLSGLPISNQPSNIILGGRSGQQPSQLPPHLNNNNKYQHIPSSSQNRYTPLSLYNPPVYIRPTTSYIQPASSSQFNNTFGQPVHSFVYQPQITTKYYPAQSSLSSSFNPGSKISNYLYDDHKLGYGHMERPTEEYLNAGNTIRPGSKLTTGNNQFIEREQSSSFPLNSQVQFKKDYLYTETNSNLGYGMNQAHENNLSSNDKTNHQFMNIAPPITINKPQTQYQASSSGYSSIPTYFPSSSSTPFTIPHYQQSSMVRPPLQAAQQPSLANRSPLLNDNKAQTLTQGPASPLMSTYVKDAKSITYENKGLYSSYMQQNNQSYAANSYQQESRDNYYEDKGNGQESYYQPISKAGNDSNAILNKNLQISNEQTQKPTNNYTSSQRNSSTYVLTSNPILYQPLNSNSATKQQTLPIGQPSSSYIQQQSTPSPSTYQYKQITNATNPHYVPQVYQQKAHHQSAYHPSEQQLQYVIEHFKQGSRYEGTKYQDMRHGQGKFFYQDGGMYEGNWKNNKMDGFGKLYYQSGKIAYEGNWTDDQFQGYGKLHNQQPDQINQMFDCENFDMIDQFWVFYEGTFIADQKDGEGKMVFNNGEQFIGNFYRDMVDGPGQFHRMNGEIVRGIWSQNQLVQLEE